MTSALNRLRTLAPPPSAGGGGPRDWAAAEEVLGRALPQDYKELVEAYGVGGFYDHVELLAPPPTVLDGDVVTRNTSHMWDLKNLWSVHGNRPAELAMDDLLLVVWADTPDSDSLNWLVRPGEPPETWPVVVLHCDLGDCEIYPMTCTEFLAGLFARDFESEILTDHLDEESAPFFPYPITQPR
ncbi:SMI1/KNR4 family protein [Streptantibioticus silvisoli]|uniref:SMI1/KNR4 family protein n=1 Tax=Streptantibioticus silvisoli TaxID=2705255 RepID=A0ABT6W447_9ACTN|nr:SMI1/KNR4 family protein [Streptantibioticus silvisoli]MDI5965528.1 SMI1/KNR4 family protein [Streptantibioticus silvisoli]